MFSCDVLSNHDELLSSRPHLCFHQKQGSDETVFYVARLVIALTNSLKFHFHLHTGEYTILFLSKINKGGKERMEGGKEGRGRKGWEKEAVAFTSFIN